MLTAGCSTFDDIGDSVDSAANVIPEALDSAGLIYRPTIIQGNIVTQEQVNGLKPGMSRRQVRFVLGSPTLRDVFHDDRWDYPYTEGVGSNPDEYKYLSIYFEGDKLVRVTGDLIHNLRANKKPNLRRRLSLCPITRDTNLKVMKNLGGKKPRAG